MGFHYFLINIILAIINDFVFMYSAGSLWRLLASNTVILILWYFVLFRKKHQPDETVLKFYLIMTPVVFILFTAITDLMGGRTFSFVHQLLFIPLMPFAPMLILSLFVPILPAILGIMVIHCILLSIKVGLKENKLYALIAAPLVVVCIIASSLLYTNREEVRYADHGFNYMKGYSSTDLSEYMVYSDPGKLVKLDHQPEIMITEEEHMPVMDGAEACYPVYSAIAKAIYKDIDKIELEALNNPNEKEYYYNGKIVTFSNTINAFDRLVYGECDMMFGARASKDQLESARSVNVDIEQTMIGKEAFVFFVERDNPVDNITSEQMRAIYHGDITNWKELGGKNEKIVAFQRPQGSGSQTMMEYFMGDVPLKEPKTYEVYNAMDGIVKKVANYANEDGALGYSFRYFIEGLMEETGVKILSIDGVYPTTENIRDGSYPLSTGLYCLTRANEDDPDVEKVLEFLLSDDGQYIIEETGYVALPKQQ